jgi:hypothetical protein
MGKHLDGQQQLAQARSSHRDNISNLEKQGNIKPAARLQRKPF